MATRLYKVLYSFQAEDEGELSVADSDIVRASADLSSSKDGWTLVETVTSPMKKGFIPSAYITKAETSTRANHDSPHVMEQRTVQRHSKGAVTSTASPSKLNDSKLNEGLRDLGTSIDRTASNPEQSPTTVSSYAPIRRLSDPRLPQHLLETLEKTSPIQSGDIETHQTTDRISYSSVRVTSKGPSAAQDAFPPPAGLASSMVVSSATPRGAQPEVEQLLSAHERWYAEIGNRREENLQALRASTGALTGKLQAIQGSNATLVKKIGELDAIIESERRKWKEQLDQEKSDISDRVAAMYTSGTSRNPEASSMAAAR